MPLSHFSFQNHDDPHPECHIFWEGHLEHQSNLSLLPFICPFFTVLILFIHKHVDTLGNTVLDPGESIHIVTPFKPKHFTLSSMISPLSSTSISQEMARLSYSIYSPLDLPVPIHTVLLIQNAPQINLNEQFNGVGAGGFWPKKESSQYKRLQLRKIWNSHSLHLKKQNAFAFNV